MRVKARISTRSGRPVGESLRRIGRKAGTALAAELYLEAEGIMAQSKELVPVDTGVLRSSGYVELPKTVGGVISVDLGYGGASQPYALIQHENLDYFHTVGQAKFLEQPFLMAKPGMAERIARSLRGKVK